MIALRPASKGDAPDLARGLNIAGNGMPLAHWQSLAAPGQDPWQVGQARVSEDSGPNSWTNATVAEVDGCVAGVLIAYDLGGVPDSIGPETPAQFAPLIELENLARNTRHIHVLAVFDAFRRQGVARRLLSSAGHRAGPGEQSIIVDATNRPAVTLYGSCGFEPVARRSARHPDGRLAGHDWTLLRKAGARDQPRIG